MHYQVKTDCEGTDWLAVCELIKEAGLAVHSVEVTKKAFENSYRVVFVVHDGVIIACGRMISDGAYQAAIYDIAVLPEYQGKKLGKLVMDELHKKLGDINVILYASPGKEAFYQKLGYRKMLTGMAHFTDMNRMRERGFIE